MTGPAPDAWAEVRAALLDADGLVRAVASGRRRGVEPPPWRRAEVRYVDLKAGRHLQVVTYDATQAHTANHAVGEAAAAAVAGLLGTAYATWHVETSGATVQARVTKRGEVLAHRTRRSESVAPDRGHDHDKARLLAADDPLFAALGLTDAQGRVKPSRQAKYRQVEEFCRLLDDVVAEARTAGHLRRPTAEDPLRVADLGCGNAYLTFAAQRVLGDVRGLPVVVTGVDVKQQSRDHNTALAARLGIEADFVVGDIAGADLAQPPDIVLALHACDTATDEALARAVGWAAPVVLAAPCCHHDIAAQLKRRPPPAPYDQVTRHGILRERLADTLTDALRASLLRREGYRVDVVEFVGSEHTPRNTMLRAVRTGALGAGAGAGEEYAALAGAWGLRPRLADLLTAPPSPGRGAGAT